MAEGIGSWRRSPCRPASCLSPSPRPPLASSSAGRAGVECAQMQQWWAKAVQGERQVGFVTGESGHWQDHAGGGLHSAREGRSDVVDWSRAVHRTVWGWRRLSARAGGPRTAVSGARGPALQRVPGPVCPELAGADAPPPVRPSSTRCGGRGATQARMLRELAEAMKH